METLTSKEIERRLGEQYAQALQDNPQFASVYKDSADVIRTSLSIMEHYNKMALNLKSRLPNKQRTAGNFSSA